jgi:hypothetical protein
LAKKGHLIDADGLATSSKDAGDNTPITDVFVRQYMKEPFSGSANMVKNFKEDMNTFVITNDGTSDLSFVINRMLVKVKAGEVFSETFSPFKKVVIMSSVPFRAYGMNALPSAPQTSNVLTNDGFERTSTSGLGSTPDGLAWEHLNATGGPVTIWFISGGKAKVNGISFQTAIVDTGMPDFYSIEADVKLASGGVAANYGGLMISHPDSANNLFFRTDGSDNTIRLYIATSPSVFALLKSSPFTFTDGQVVKFKVFKRGASIEILADGVSVLTHTLSDADYQRTISSKQGLFSKSKEADFDNFKVEMLEG